MSLFPRETPPTSKNVRVFENSLMSHVVTLRDTPAPSSRPLMATCLYFMNGLWILSISMIYADNADNNVTLGKNLRFVIGNSCITPSHWKPIGLPLTIVKMPRGKAKASDDHVMSAMGLTRLRRAAVRCRPHSARGGQTERTSTYLQAVEGWY